jgi:hypothetical protein
MSKNKAAIRSPWTNDDLRELKAHSKAKTIGIGLGHRR